MDAATHGQDYSSSIAALVPFFEKFRQLSVESADVFNDEHDLPPWLHGVAENTLHAVDAATLAAYTRLPASLHRRSYWIKASSVLGLQYAVAHSPDDVQEELRTAPLCVYLMPTTPLLDSQGILNLSTGVEQLALVPVEGGAEEEAPVAVCIYNMADCEAKVTAFHTAQGVVEQIRQTRQMVREHRDKIFAEAHANVVRAQERKAEYDAAKQEMEAAKAAALPEQDGTTAVLFPERLNMMIPFTGFHVAHEIAKAMTKAAEQLDDLDEVLEEKEAQVEGFTRSFTFMGCASPAPAAGAAADAHGHGGGNNAN